MKEANRNLALRAASALVLFPVAVWATWQGGLFFAAVCAAAALLAAGEVITMFAPFGLAEALGAAVAALFPLAPWYGGGAGLPPGAPIYPAWAPIALAFAGMGLLTLHLFRTPQAEVPRRAMAVCLAWIYVGPTVASVVDVRLRFGFGWVILAFVVTWLNDTLAYFAGRFLGKHKMLERVSPKKTWEGFGGGVAGSVLGALVVKALDPAHDLVSLSWVGATCLGLGAAVLGPLGDLCESLLKRAAGVKDSGHLIPGHGGLLDRIDALLFVAPWVWIYAFFLR